jgi:hypothetical protein
MSLGARPLHSVWRLTQTPCNQWIYGATTTYSRDATLGMEGDLLYYNLHHAAL